MTREGSGLWLMRNAHTPYNPGQRTNGSELGPISQQGVKEALAAGDYFSQNLGGRTLRFYMSPFTRRARDTALYALSNVAQNGAPAPEASDLLKLTERMQPVGYLPPDEVAIREYEAVLSLEAHLRSVENLTRGKLWPVVVMSGRAIWHYFGHPVDSWPTDGNEPIATGAVLSTAKNSLGRYTFDGHNTEGTRHYVEGIDAKRNER